MRICTVGACSLFKVTLTHTYACHTFVCGRLTNKILSPTKPKSPATTKSRIYSVFYELYFSCSLFGPSGTLRTYLLAHIRDKFVEETKKIQCHFSWYTNSKSIRHSKWKQKRWTFRSDWIENDFKNEKKRTKEYSIFRFALEYLLSL